MQNAHAFETSLENNKQKENEMIRKEKLENHI